MSLVTGAIPSLHNGVSQQSALVRSPDQCEQMTNGWASLAEGTGKRPPTEHVARLMAEAPEDAFIHQIVRDEVEQYLVIAADGVIRVFDTLTGTEESVTYADSSYLADVESWSRDIAMFTVADYTFVVNKRRICQMAERGSDTQADPLDYLWLNRGTGEDSLDQSYSPGAAYQYPPNPVVTALTGTVQAFDKLPEDAPQGAVYRVSGTDTTGFVSYYVRRNGGVWDECLAPGLTNAVDALSMPHALVREGDGSFVFAPFSWAPRRVGDTDTNPNPGFIGRSIRSLYFYQNRLALVYGENAAMSVSGDFGNFWRMTVLDYIDSDVIDVAATNTTSPSGGVTTLEHAVGFNDGVMLFSGQSQFSMTNGETGLSASSIAIRPVTNYEVALAAAPVPNGSEVYFGSEKNGWATIYEYTRQADSDATSASNVTAHVPSYVPAGLRKLIPAPDLNALFVLTSGAPNKVFVYQFYWSDATNKAQSAWHEWTFPEGVRVVSGGYIRGCLYLALARPDGLHLERVNLQAGSKPELVDRPIYLDRLAPITGTFEPTSGRTSFTLPYAPTDQSEVRAVLTAAPRPLSLIDPTSVLWTGPSTFTVPGNVTAPVYAGERFTFVYTFSPQFLQRQGGGAITTGRLMLRTFTVSYRNTAYFRTEVRPYGAAMDPQVEEVLPGRLADFTGKVLGAHDLVLNQPAYHEGSYSFTVGGEAQVATISLINDSHVGSTFVAAEWEAFYWNRARI